MSKIAVNIYSSRPVFIEADADSFGNLFAGMSDEEQVHVLRAMVEHMKPHQMQWDYIAIALEKEENHDVRDNLQYVLFSDIAAKDAEIAKLREETRELLQLAYQYRDDLRHPPLPDSRERRLQAIEAVISKAEGGAS